ncbi:MAG: glutamine--fructose-6-phosphate aminotransferase, partial [Chloroflexi bacterium]|nr:glutamine--fructose-6-phosphate aminotransferase [Chloroflexota bacterium]
MCGIIAYCGTEAALPIVLSGLKRLEYRGYDSAGVAILDAGGAITVFKSAGRINDLHSAVDHTVRGATAIGHTRLATHGRPADYNAHPHVDCSGKVAVIHNGIVENYLDLKAQLEREGHTFRSQTDTEVIPHLIEKHLQGGMGFEDAVRRTASQLEGAHAIVVVNQGSPGTVIGARIGHAGGLVVGYGHGAMYLAS